MSLKDEYFAMMISRFKRWDAELGMLSEKAGQTSGEAGTQLNEEIKALRASRNAAYGKLQEIRTASESAWRRLQAIVDPAWVSMKLDLDKASFQSRSRK